MRQRFDFRSSSLLRAASYDDTDATLEVEFRHGGRYRYFLVPRRVVSDLVAAPSAGRYFNHEIRPRFKEQKLA